MNHGRSHPARPSFAFAKSARETSTRRPWAGFVEAQGPVDARPGRGRRGAGATCCRRRPVPGARRPWPRRSCRTHARAGSAQLLVVRRVRDRRHLPRRRPRRRAEHAAARAAAGGPASRAATVTRRCSASTSLRKVSGSVARSAYSSSRTMCATTRLVGPHVRRVGLGQPPPEDGGSPGRHQVVSHRRARAPRGGAIVGVRLVGRDRAASLGHRVVDHPALVAHQRQPRRTSTSGGLRRSRRSRVSRRQKVTAECCRRSTPRRAARRRAHGGTTSWAKRPSATNSRLVAEVERPLAGAAVVRDVVDRHLGPALAAERGDRGHRVVGQPRVGVVPVGQPALAPWVMTRQRGVAAVLVEVVEPQHREPEPFGEP